MMTASDVTASDRLPEREEGWKAAAPMDGCSFSGYESSDKGHARSIDRKQGNRQLTGKVLAERRSPDGYLYTNIRCDSTDPGHNRVHTVTMHKLMLTTWDKPCPEGMEACHDPKRGPACNWREFVRWDTKKANAAEKLEQPVPQPVYPCRNAESKGCAAKVMNEGRRCGACVAGFGRQAADMLRDGLPLPVAALRLECSEDWAYKMAVKHGGFGGSQAEAARPPRVVAEELAAAVAALGVPLHTLCRCPACQPARGAVAPGDQSRNVFARLFGTNRGGRPS